MHTVLFSYLISIGKDSMQSVPFMSATVILFINIKMLQWTLH